MANQTASMLFLLVPMIAIYYFLLIRPQQKRIKDHRAMIEGLRRGDRILTQGGIIGKITKVKEGNEIEIEIAPNVKVEVIKSTIQTVISKTDPVES